MNRTNLAALWADSGNHFRPRPAVLPVPESQPLFSRPGAYLLKARPTHVSHSLSIKCVANVLTQGYRVAYVGRSVDTAHLLELARQVGITRLEAERLEILSDLELDGNFSVYLAAKTLADADFILFYDNGPLPNFGPLLKALPDIPKLVVSQDVDTSFFDLVYDLEVHKQPALSEPGTATLKSTSSSQTYSIRVANINLGQAILVVIKRDSSGVSELDRHSRKVRYKILGGLAEDPRRLSSLASGTKGRTLERYQQQAAALENMGALTSVPCTSKTGRPDIFLTLTDKGRQLLL